MKTLKTIGPRLRTIDTRTVKPPPKVADAELQTPEHRAWAIEVKRRAGWRCEWVEKGERCKVAAPGRLFADHIVERRDGGDRLDPKNGRCLCGRHHSLKTAAERAKRMVL
ncbi:HNH endonuclease signature motif containing protein [Hansschlegelia sp.]|uniref:HNH endonuclease signature motif containing protein n=1 Tax=Hansschlegelia sp. TaxID=2041892 RepID=UPI002BD0A2AA|nr:HNH endonuclease signature motif containing protein [Hansschlegelia sp.]HVI30451.1 HNH endonuclease signature motif containing protein [Hansschlegelia sp.]